MEIFNQKKKFKIKPSGKKYFRFIAILILFVFLLTFGFGSLLYGAYLNKTGQTVNIKNLALRLADFNFSFIPNHVQSNLIEIENFSFDVKFKNWEKLRYYREKGLLNGSLNNLPAEEVKAKIRFKDKTYKAKIKITGQTTQHIIHPYKWSLLVKLENGETIKGINKFALLYPRSRGYLTDWIAIKLLESKKLIGLKTDFVNVEINGKDHGLYYFEERFSKNLLFNNNREDGIIFKRDDELKVYELNKHILKSKDLSIQLSELKKLLHAFYTNQLKVEEVFDIEKFATLFVVSDLMNSKHALFRGNSRLYFNPVTHLIEPIGREWDYLRKETVSTLSLSIEQPNSDVNYHENMYKDSVLVKFLYSTSFLEEYLKQANIFSSKKYLDSILDSNYKQKEFLLNKIYAQNPFYIFPINELYKNQEIIRQKINPVSPSLNVYFDKLIKDSLVLNFKNRIDLPLEIHSVLYGYKKLPLKERMIIQSEYRSNKIPILHAFEIPESIDISNFYSDSLEVQYSLLGINKIRKSIVFPKFMKKNDYLKLTPNTRISNIEEFDFLKVNKIEKIIEFSKTSCNIKKDLIIPQDYIVKINPGTILNLINSASITSYSPLLFFGNKENPIIVTSEDFTGEGIFVSNCSSPSEFNYVNFNSLSQSDKKLKGILTFYESQVNINHCEFENNGESDLFLHFIQSEVGIYNSTFKNIFTDALCMDFCVGEIENVSFDGINGNTIKSRKSKLFLTDINIRNSNGNGIQVEKETLLIGEKIEIIACNIALESKDGSSIEVNDIRIDSSNMAFSAWNGNNGFNPSSIKVTNSILNYNKKNFHVKVGCSIVHDGQEILSKTKNIQSKLSKDE